MKSSDPPISVIRNQVFKTDLNEVILFKVKNVFYRVYDKSYNFKIDLKLDKTLQPVHINEYVIWQILEPLIQNSIDHNQKKDLKITISTNSMKDENGIEIIINDNGKGLSEELLEINDQGIQRVFLEQTTTKVDASSSGYGCFIAYENCKRCGWKILTINNSGAGSRTIISIPKDSNA